MPILGPADVLPARPRRVVVNGTSGSGKSTLARRIGVTLGLPYTELDSLFHGPGWTRLETFEAEVERFSLGPTWATEWQYDAVRGRLVQRADLMVWLDLPRWLVMARVTRRTVVRRWRREPLWNGNQEGPLRGILTDPEHIIRWAWDTHHQAAERTQQVNREYLDLPIVRLRSPREIESWLAGPLTATLGEPTV